MTVELLPAELATPDNPEWHKLRRDGVTASEIAAVLGISPWESPFSLYWQKLNGWTTEDNEEMATGRRVEPVVALWWRDTFDTGVRRAGLYAHADRPWQLATPDRLTLIEGGPADGQVAGVLECKWTGSWDGWGEPGTDDIPVYYRAQVLWQIDVLGVDEGHLAVLGPGGFRAYGPIRRDERDLTVMREASRRFLDRLAAGDQPDIDGHPATGRALKALHPSVEDFDVEVPVALAEGYRRARALRARIEKRVDAYEAQIRQAIGPGRRAMCNGRLVASRSVYDQSGDMADLDSLDTDRPTVNRLNPGRSKSYA